MKKIYLKKSAEVQKSSEGRCGCHDTSEVPEIIETATPEPCQCKHKHRTENERKTLINRLRRIEGQVRGLEKMVENDAYCTDIVTQVSAVQAALNAFSKQLLANHIQTCVIQDIRNGKDEVVEDLIHTIHKLMK